MDRFMMALKILTNTNILKTNLHYSKTLTNTNKEEAKHEYESVHIDVWKRTQSHH